MKAQELLRAMHDARGRVSIADGWQLTLSAYLSVWFPNSSG